jgi:hypothetical protein
MKLTINMNRLSCNRKSLQTLYSLRSYLLNLLDRAPSIRPEFIDYRLNDCETVVYNGQKVSSSITRVRVKIFKSLLYMLHNELPDSNPVGLLRCVKYDQGLNKSEFSLLDTSSGNDISASCRRFYMNSPDGSCLCGLLKKFMFHQVFRCNDYAKKHLLELYSKGASGASIIAEKCIVSLSVKVRRLKTLLSTDLLKTKTLIHRPSLYVKS